MCDCDRTGFFGLLCELLGIREALEGVSKQSSAGRGGVLCTERRHSGRRGFARRGGRLARRTDTTDMLLALQIRE